MAFCEECGSRIPDSAVRCPVCGAAAIPLEEERPPRTEARSSRGPAAGGQPQYPPRSQAARPRTPGFSPVQARTQTQPRPQGQPPKTPILAENEKVVRQYQCTKLRQPKCDGYLTVTNKRIIFQGEASTSRVDKEVVLDSVSGLDCYYGMNIRAGGLILGAILAILGLYFLFNRDGSVGMALLALVIAAVIVLLSIRKTFYLSVWSSKASGTPINIGQGATSIFGNGALYSLMGAPTSETDRMLSELGALIQDLQTLGDHAIEKWNR